MNSSKWQKESSEHANKGQLDPNPSGLFFNLYIQDSLALLKGITH